MHVNMDTTNPQTPQPLSNERSGIIQSKILELASSSSRFSKNTGKLREELEKMHKKHNKELEEMQEKLSDLQCKMQEKISDFQIDTKISKEHIKQNNIHVRRYAMMVMNLKNELLGET